MLIWLLNHFGWLEVVTRRIAAQVSPNFKRKLKAVYLKLAHDPQRHTEISQDETSLEQVYDYIRRLGIKKGDILLVHSSADGMKVKGLSSRKTIDFLLSLVGDEGTLVFPSFPVVNRPDIFRQNGEVPLYDPQRTLCWTGLLPNIFIKYPGVIRSLYPYNSLAALGKHAEEMMSENLNSITPHGKNSAWEYCVDNDAKILFLGVPPTRCCTVLHAVEDIMADEWPYTDWYLPQKYRIKVGDQIIEKEIEVFNPKWYQYSRSHQNIYNLTRRGYINSNTISDTYIGFISNSKAMVDHLINTAKQGKTRYLMPRKYRKRG